MQARIARVRQLLAHYGAVPIRHTSPAYAASVRQALRAHGGRLTELTGLQLDPYFVAPKVAWLRPQVGDGPTISTTDAWLLHRLCGAYVTDASTASRKGSVDGRSDDGGSSSYGGAHSAAASRLGA